MQTATAVLLVDMGDAEGRDCMSSFIQSENEKPRPQVQGEIVLKLRYILVRQ